MRCVPYYACCGAYFLCDLDEASILDINTDPNKLPRIPNPNSWSRGDKTMPDYSKAGVKWSIVMHPSIAYMFAILKHEEKLLGDLLCKLHGFKLMSSSKDKLLYCRERGNT